MKLNKLLLITSLVIAGCTYSKEQTTQSQDGQMEFSENISKPNEFWWPKKVNLSPLRQNALESNPYGEKFNYAAEFKKLDLQKVKADIKKTLTNSQDWWPADYGNYGPFFIRMAWHSAGTYRVLDGRGGAAGGQQRFEPLNSWPDNANLDKARRLLWPVKQKYGSALSWADLMVLAGNVSLESMGFETIGFAGGRVDDFEPDLVYWGPENKFLDSERFSAGRKLDDPLAATRMGLIYVNPEGPNGEPDPLKAAKDIRETFGRMAMDDEETVALIAGGHTFGKAHGAMKAECLGAEPAAAGIEEQGFGWKNNCGSGKGADTITSGLEGSWSAEPTKWTHQYLNNLFAYEWEKVKSPAGATQWQPKNIDQASLAPDAHNPDKKHPPIMFTTDLALKFDPAYRKIAERFRRNPQEFKQAFAKAWFKLTHRDMGPNVRYVGKDSPKETFTWQDPLPKAKYNLINSAEISALKKKILNSGLTNSELVKTAFAAASSFRVTDMRGGANGARINLEPQRNWEVNNPKELAKTLAILEKIKNDFNKKLRNKKVSLADVIVLGGSAAVEKAAKDAGYYVKVPFMLGRVDATQEQTDVKSFAFLEPKADGFRNYYSEKSGLSPVNALVDRAYMLDLTVPEMTALLGGMRVLSANYDDSNLGILTNRPGVLSNDFFVNLLDMSVEWKKLESRNDVYKGYDRQTGKLKWVASPVDLVFGSSSELRAISEVYAANDGEKKFINDFVKVWTKVMQLDRFDATKRQFTKSSK